MKRESIATSLKAESSNQEISSSPHSGSPSKFPFPIDLSPASSVSASPLRKSSNSTASDVDFSPSTGLLDLPTKLHPVPTSLDNGTTLDWTGLPSNDGERHWTHSIVRKREKDVLPPLGIMVDEQEQLHKGGVEMSFQLRTL